MKILNLYAGIGGNRKHWDQTGDHQITAVEYDPKIAAIYQDFFPNDTVIVADAHQYLLDHYKEYNNGFIWLSPPCQSHSAMNIATRHELKRYPDMKLYQEIILLQSVFKGLFLCENVIPYYTSLIAPTYQIYRHNFWCNFKIQSFEAPKPDGNFIRDFSVTKLKEYLGFENLEGKNYNTRQMLRNCVHPEIGLAILESALGIIKENSVKNGQLF